MIDSMSHTNIGQNRQRILGNEVPEISDSIIRIQKDLNAIEGIVSKIDNSEMALFYAVPDGFNAFVGTSIDANTGKKGTVVIAVTDRDSKNGTIVIVLRTKITDGHGGYTYNSYRVDTDETVWSSIEDSSKQQSDSSESVIGDDSSIFVEGASDSNNSDEGDSTIIIVIILCSFVAFYMSAWI